MTKIIKITLLVLFLLCSVISSANIKIISSKSEGNKIIITLEIDENLWMNRLQSIKMDAEIYKNSLPDIDFDLFINVIKTPMNVNVKYLNSSKLSIDRKSIPLSLNMKETFENRGIFIYKGKKYVHLKLLPKTAINYLNIFKKIRIVIDYDSPQKDAVYYAENSFLNLKGNLPKERYAENQNDLWIDFNSDYLKIGVAQDGIFRIDRTDLNSFGIPAANIDPKTFQLYLRGKEVPIFVAGESDNSFDDIDYIEFAGMINYGGRHREISSGGEPYNEYFNRYGDTTIYFLRWGIQPGQRVTLKPFIPANDSINYYTEIIHKEKDVWFDFSMTNLVEREMPYWASNKTWNEGIMSVGSSGRPFNLIDLYPAGKVRGFVKFQDFASNIASNAHSISLNIDALPMKDTITVDKYSKATASVEYDVSEFSDGQKIQLKINSLPTDAVLNAIILDWFELEYPRYLRAIDDSLKFTFPSIANPKLYNVRISNLSGTNYSVWKKGNEYSKYSYQLTNNNIEFTDTINSTDMFFLSSEQKLLKPKFYYSGKINNLKSSDIQADYLIITHKKFLDLAEQYAVFIEENYSVKSKVIDIDNIYDQYSFGFFNPEVIRDFLQSTHSFWRSPKPEYCFLIGAATYDYHGNKQKYQGYPASLNYVPSFGASVSDNWFTLWDSTGAFLPQMTIGRLAVNNSEELNWYFQKHKEYLLQDYNDWNKSFLFLSGGTGTNQAQIDQLKSVNDFIIDNLAKPAPVGGKIRHFYKTINPKTNFGPFSKTEIQNAFDEGALFISYIGHSGTRTWDNSITEAYQLKNKRSRYPLVSDFGCSTGRFAEPDVTSFSELFTLSNDGQAIAYVGNSSLGFVSTATTVPQLFYGYLLADTLNNIAKALNSAKIDLLNQYGYTSVNRLFSLTNTYFGDPIIELKLPPKPNLVITDSNIRIEPSIPSDNDDSLRITAAYINSGLADDSNFVFTIYHQYKDDIDTINYSKSLPLLNDSIRISIPIKNLPGSHKFIFILDDEKKIDEIYEDDNSAEITINVSSSSFRSLLPYPAENAVSGELRLLNPPTDSTASKLVIDFDLTKNFSSPITETDALTPFATDIGLNNLIEGKRYYFRTRKAASANYSGVETFIKSSFPAKYLLSDSLSFSNISSRHMRFFNNRLELSSDTSKFEILSAGFNDGNTAVIMKNGVNYIPEATLRGHHICLFDTADFRFVKYIRFDLLGGGAAEAQNYINFLDTLSAKYYVLFAVSDEGRVGNSTLRAKIKEFGSANIDDVGFRYSWAMIGRRGAAPGSVPENFSAPTFGSVKVDTIFTSPFNSGMFETGLVGPSNNWDKIFKVDSTSQNSAIDYYPIKIINGISDTLTALSFNSNGAADISFLNSVKPITIKLLSKVRRNAQSAAPSIKSIGINYKSLSELTTSYNLISVSRDSIIQGDSISVSFGVVNVGEIDVDSTDVKLYLVKTDNQKSLLSSLSVENLAQDSVMKSSFIFQDNYLNGWGKMFFEIVIDEDNLIPEFYEDNNIYRIPFEVKKDTITNLEAAYIKVLFNDSEIFDNETINSNPRIEMNLKYQPLFNYSDTTRMKVFLDGERQFVRNMDSVRFDTVQRVVTYVMKPKLKKGTHFLNISGQNLIGNLQGENGYSLNFNVSEDLEILNVYNYPNPMGSETHFLFSLTDVPDDISIKIFTVSGRLIKSINSSDNELSYNLNKIYWDGRDEDGDPIANGVYFYKVIAHYNGKTKSVVQKLAVVR